MKKEKKPYLVKIAEKISDDRDEQEIIQYGMHQGFLILCNILDINDQWIILGRSSICYICILGDFLFEALCRGISRRYGVTLLLFIRCNNKYGYVRKKIAGFI